MEKRKAVWVILFTIRCASLTLSRDERFQAVWVIFFRIRSASLTLNRMDRIIWVILFTIRDVQVLPRTGRKGWQSGSSCSESDTYIYIQYKSYLEQGGEESSLGHLVQTYGDTVMEHLWSHQSHIQTTGGLHLILPIWWQKDALQFVQPGLPTEEKSKLLFHGKGTLHFSLFSISLYASTEVFVCKKLAYIMTESNCSYLLNKL